MRAIFISYRREDSEGQAGRLFKDLVARFGADSVFMDVAGIEPGRDFRRVIDQQVASCGVLLAMIGKHWLDAKDAAGHRRLDDPSDFVRLETATALKRDIPVIPVLVQDADMPRAEQLPADLADLAYRNGVELTHARWDSDVQVLIKALDPYMEGEARTNAGAGDLPSTVNDGARKRPPVGLIAAAVAALVAIVGGFLAYNRPERADPPWPEARQQQPVDATARTLAEAEQARKDEARAQAEVEQARAQAEAEQARRDEARARTEAERARAMAEAEQARNEAARAQAEAERARAEAAAAREEAARLAAAKEDTARLAAARAQAAAAQAEAERAARARTMEVDFSAITRRTYRIGPVTIRNIGFNPFPPSVLAEHQEVITSFAYDVCCGYSALIWVRPVWTGSQCSYGASGSPVYSGRGNGSSSFNMRGAGCRSAVISGIRFSVKNQANNESAETVIPVRYTFQ
jgi:hypothetical protein